MENITKEDGPVLSISLLVSDRKDTIRKCMESLRHLMKAVKSELIAVDTGGTDGSIEVVREYTNKIIKFDWCDDFAAARNAGLDVASGEWFLFLDDDEWFENTEEIEAFFISGEYKDYQSAQYLVRNYAADGTMADAYVSRMCKCNQNLHFTGRIHEHFEPIYGPTKYFKAYVHHYGYCYRTEEDRQNHFERNVKLLKKELRKNPKDIRNLCQLAQEYETVKDLENEISICRLAINNIHSTGIISSTGINWMMVALVRILAYQNKSEEVLKEGKRILDKGPYELSRSIILAHMTEESLTIKSYQEAVYYAKEHIRLIHILEDNSEMASSQSMLTMTFSYARGLYDIVIKKGLEACCATSNYVELKLFLELLFGLDENSIINEVCSYVESLKEKYPDCSNKLTEGMASLENSKSVAYLLLQQLLSSLDTKEKIIQDKYDICVLKCLEQQVFLGEILKIAGKKELKHTIMLEKMERKKWEDWVISSLRWLTTGELWGLKKGLLKENNNSLKHLSFLVTLERQILIVESEHTKEYEVPIGDGCGRYMEAIYCYCKDGMSYFRRLYRPEVFYDENGINLTKECRFLLCLEEAIQAEEQGDVKGCITRLRRAVHINPPMASTLNFYIDIVSQKALCKEIEIRKLGEKVKKEVYKLIQANQYEEAFPILEQLLEILPNDEELRLLLDEIRYKKDE